MNHAGLVLSVMTCSCSGLEFAERTSPPTLADLPRAPAARLEAERAIDRPPVKVGETRIAQFDVDVALPANATVYQSVGRAYVSWPRCSVEVIPWLKKRTPQPPGGPLVGRRVGTLELACVAGRWSDNAMHPSHAPDPRCLTICDHMTPVPGSTAEDRYPTDLPVIEIERQGGLFYREEATLVWSDGTVQYSGSKCRTWRGRRATLAPERVAALLAAVEHSGFFTYHPVVTMACSDAIYGTVTVRGAGRRTSLDFSQCDGTGLPAFVGDLQRAIGNNPCMPF